MFVEENIKKARLGLCRGCDYYFDNHWLANFLRLFGIKTGTCGRPILGQKVLHYFGKGIEKIIKLCGCVMESKATLEEAHCPAKKW